MATVQVNRRTTAARLDRLQITSVHRQMMWIVAIVFFFELGDLNAFAFAAPAARVRRLCRFFGEVQQDLLLSCLAVGQAYCLLEVFQ